MKRKLVWGFILLTIALPVGLAAKCGRSGPGLDDPLRTGGPCRYEDYAGVITVKAVSQEGPGGANDSQPNLDRKSVVLTVEFRADVESDAPAEARRFEENVAVTQKESEAKGAKVGKKYRASAKYQSQGTCNPGPYLASFNDWK